MTPLTFYQKPYHVLFNVQGSRYSSYQVGSSALLLPTYFFSLATYRIYLNIADTMHCITLSLVMNSIYIFDMNEIAIPTYSMIRKCWAAEVSIDKHLRTVRPKKSAGTFECLWSPTDLSKDGNDTQRTSFTKFPTQYFWRVEDFLLSKERLWIEWLCWRVKWH